MQDKGNISLSKMAKFQHRKLSDFLQAPNELPDSFRKTGQRTARSKTNSDGGQLFDFLMLIRSWEKIVGASAANHSLPLKFTGGTLTILCSHPAWSKELAMLEQELRGKIKNLFPAIATSLKNIKFMTGPGELQRLRETLLKGPEKSSVTSTMTKENFQRYHPHSPHYKRMREEAESILTNSENDDIIEADVKELLISLIIQSKQS
ncbi:MAG: hypothetical protein A2X86_06470 [Bdellovibrionales bacterium GWA2_49_15]|nr:MAG: hypothetical protein A2X86_06470 [Bdellovibrionales bacterium GWA2_49_15]HAZ12083.1 hypothetical protein [Bdellovibrionales bacterium]